MSAKKVRTAVDELADKADGMLNLCWRKLRAKEATREDIELMVEGWGLKYDVFQVKEEEKELKAILREVQDD